MAETMHVGGKPNKGRALATPISCASRPENYTYPLHGLAKDCVIRAWRMHCHCDFIRTHNPHDLVEIYKRDRVSDLPVGNGRRHRSDAICSQRGRLHANQLIAAPYRKTSKHQIRRAKGGKRLEGTQRIGHILDGARRMDEINAAK